MKSGIHGLRSNSHWLILWESDATRLRISFEYYFCDLPKPKNRSEGLDPNGICYPCVMGWGLAGTGNSSAAAVAAVVAPKMCFCLETVSFAKGSNMRDLGAILPPF